MKLQPQHITAKQVATLLLPLLLLLAPPVARAAVPVRGLQQLLDSVRQIMKEEQIPGLALSLVHRDSVIWEGGLGLADIEKQEPVTALHLFRQGSVSKMLGALAIMKLAEEGAFSLEDELRMIAPEIAFTNRYELTHPVRVMHLLEHTAGFDDMHVHALYNFTFNEPSGREMIDRHRQSLNTRWLPGTRHAYSNSGYVVVTYLIEKFSGRAYDDYIQKTILEPLGMNHSNFTSFPWKEEKYSSGYKMEKGELTYVPFRAIVSGVAGTFNSCPQDMSKLLRFFLRNGLAANGQPLFTPVQINRMERPGSGITISSDMQVGYGLGNFTMHYDTPYLFHGHNGAIDGFYSVMAYNRDLGVGYAVANNGSASNRRIQQLLANWLLSGFPVKKTVTLPLDSAAVQPWLGYYDVKNPRQQILNLMETMFGGAELYMAGGELFLKEDSDKPQKLLHTGNLLFKREGHNTATVKLATSPGGSLVVASGFSGYYEKSSKVRPWIYRVLVFGALLNMLLLLLPGIIWTIFFLKKDLKKRDFSVRILPVLASVSFLLSFFVFNDLISEPAGAGLLSVPTALVFVGTLLFGAFACCGLWMNARYFSEVTYRPLAWYLLVANIFLCTFATCLTSENLMGLRLWEY